MALDFSRFNFFNKLDARARVVVLFLGVIGLIVLIYVGTQYLGGGSNTIGPSRVASAPAGLQSVPGGTTATAEYQRALSQANVQIAEAAKMSGGSAIATQINTGNTFGLGSCVVCSDKSANVKNLLDKWVSEGKVTPDVADMLQNLANKNVSVEEYADTLNRLVKDGKLTPEQARALLDEYKKQHTNAMLGDSEKMMDALIKSGQLPLDVANQLLDAQRKGVTTDEYANMLQKLVRDGKISPATAQQLLQQYNNQCLRESAQKNNVTVNQMAQNGSVTQDVAKRLVDLTNNNAPVDNYSAELNDMVSKGKLTPAAAGNLLDAYKQVKSACGSSGTLNELLQQAENAAYQELSDLLAAGQITAETAAQLTSLIQNNVSLDEYKAVVNQLLQDKKLTPEIAQLKIGDYTRVKQLRDAKEQLAKLQANNASEGDYAEALKRLVAAGVITPEQASQLLREYRGLTAAAVAPTVGGGAFGELAQKLATANASAPAAEGEFATVQAQTALETAQERQARLSAIMGAMMGQAGQLISAWQPTNMVHREGAGIIVNKEGVLAAPVEPGPAGGPFPAVGVAGAPLIKAGTIIFGVLDTAINSDYPDTPVLVTIVFGKFKGAKLLGRIVTTKGVTGQMDRVSMNFTMMNDDAWPKSKNVTAYGIDPDTARTVMASSVNYHYLMRFGAIMATSFLQGYSTAITNEGTSTTGIFGTSTTHPSLSQSSKIMVGLGQIGQTLGAATQNYINRPPTVRVDSGVSLGILFMSDVT